jgi:protein-L-isoaspartate(D-aspartate) O-methyltransferase
MEERNWKRLLEKRQLPDLPEERAQMVAALRESGYSERVLEAMSVVPRHAFVTGPLWRLAYSMIDLWGPDQFVPSPQTIALIVDNLNLDSADSVLEYGTGSGYLTAVLSLMTEHVYTVEHNLAQLWTSSDSFRESAIPNIRQKQSDWRLGWPEFAPFARIVVCAAVPQLFGSLLRQVQSPGVIIAPVGAYHGPQRLTRLEIRAGGDVVKDLGPCVFPSLYGGWSPGMLADMPDVVMPDEHKLAVAGPIQDSAWQVWAG